MTIDEEIAARSEVFMATSQDPRITGRTPTEQEAVDALKFLAAMMDLVAKKKTVK